MKTRAVVVSLGATTPLARGAAPTAFLNRAAMGAMRTSPLLDNEGQPATLCFLPTLEPYSVGAARAIALGETALAEVIRPLTTAASGARVEMVICVDSFMADLDDPIGPRPAKQVAASLSRIASRHLAIEDVVTIARGEASLGKALPRAIDALTSGRVDTVLLGGVHSDYSPARVKQLHAARRLFTTDNIDAVIPGEGAAFVALMREEVARSRGLPVLLRINEVGEGVERARPDNDVSAFEAAGMTAAVVAATAPLTEAGMRAGWMLTDVGFERWRFYELSAVGTRTQSIWCEPQYADAPAQRLGALGAAAGPLHLVLAAAAHRGGFAPHARCLSLCGSDDGQRAAVLLSGP